jgi:hypothetical protein
MSGESTNINEKTLTGPQGSGSGAGLGVTPAHTASIVVVDETRVTLVGEVEVKIYANGEVVYTPYLHLVIDAFENSDVFYHVFVLTEVERGLAAPVSEAINTVLKTLSEKMQRYTEALRQLNTAIEELRKSGIEVTVSFGGRIVGKEELPDFVKKLVKVNIQ